VRQCSTRPSFRAHALVKIKLDATPSRCVRWVREVRGDAAIIVDANEGWDLRAVGANPARARRSGVGNVEQPLPRGADQALAGFASPIPLCADKAAPPVPACPRWWAHQAINIGSQNRRADREALALAEAAQAERLT
jgi:L-alanine-DL-glutamate epimerase-like enolase superfamily enzyme